MMVPKASPADKLTLAPQVQGYSGPFRRCLHAIATLVSSMS